ncbi:MAG: FecCD family ABC transporter permease [Shimia sp.]|uniref:FecCD family ABC transporter permease n=1 Tax=Shimia sp. TaxID=1954381 RepID=UPI004057D4E4
MSKAEVRLLGLTLFLGAVILIALLVLSTIFGTTAIPVSEALKAVVLGLGLAEGDMSPLHRIVFELRLPRALFAAVIGAGLGVVGVVLQTTTRNDLADPFLFGLSSGAAAGAVFVITVTGDILGFWTLPLAAFSGGLIASGIVLALVHSLRTSAPEKLILAGLAVSFLFSAITNYLIFAGDSRAAHSVIFWMLGGLGLARWETFPLVCAGLLLVLTYVLYCNRSLDALLTGDLTATTLGVPVRKLRLRMFFVAALTTAMFVCVAGAIGFVGLMVPHIARGIVGPLHRHLVPTAAIVGAVLLTGSDILSRLLLAPQELPVGIVTTSIGSVFVFVLLFRTAKAR